MNRIQADIINITLVLSIVVTIILFSGCKSNKDVDINKILIQLPDYNRVAIVPSQFAEFDTKKFNVKFFSEIVLIQEESGVKYTEDEFYKVARSLGAQYIIISSDMTKNNLQFPWMTNKNFRVCPGTVDHKTDVYYTLLVWDHSKNSYHFFKFLYE